MRKDYQQTLSIFVPQEAKDAFDQVRDENDKAIASQVDQFTQSVSEEMAQQVEALRTQLEQDFNDSLNALTSLVDHLSSGTDVSRDDLKAAAKAMQTTREAAEQRVRNFGTNLRKGLLTVAKSAGLPIPDGLVSSLMNAGDSSNSTSSSSAGSSSTTSSTS